MEKQTPTQRVDLQVGEEKLLVQVEEAYDEVGQDPADTGDNKVFSVLKIWEIQIQLNIKTQILVSATRWRKVMKACLFFF